MEKVIDKKDQLKVMDCRNSSHWIVVFFSYWFFDIWHLREQRDVNVYLDVIFDLFLVYGVWLKYE